MKHPDDGTLQSLVDGELTEERHGAIQAHLAGCPECAERVRAGYVDRELVGRALSLLDQEEAPTEAAKRTVLERVRTADVEARRIHPRRWWRTGLARAAGLVLALAGAASAALPGSPVRQWLEGRWAQELPTETSTAEPVAPVAPVPEAPREVGIQLDAPDGPLRISITGLAPGSEVEVRLVDGARSGVYAPVGTRFSSTPDGLQAYVDGAYARVEVARAVSSVEVEVDGALYLRKIGDRLELPGPGKDSTEAQFRFQVP